MRHLLQVELATIRFEAPAPEDVQAIPDMAGEAAVSLAMWMEIGYLRGLSGERVARDLQWRFFVRSFNYKRPWRGLQLLLEVDEIGDETGVKVWLDSLCPDDDRHFRTLRLKDRVAELTGSPAFA